MQTFFTVIGVIVVVPVGFIAFCIVGYCMTPERKDRLQRLGASMAKLGGAVVKYQAAKHQLRQTERRYAEIIRAQER